MSNSYLDKLEAELRSEGVNPLTSSAVGNDMEQKIISPDDYDLKTILEMEQVTGVKYSDEQREVLKHHGNACIIACAGSGKTSSVISLIAKRIKTGEIRDTNKLIYATYNKAGATEMEERLGKLLKQLGINKTIQVRTLHAFFLSILRTFGVTAKIIDGGDRARMIKEACKENDFALKDDDLMLMDQLLSYQVNNLLSDRKTIESYINTFEDLTVEQYSKIRSGYANRKVEKGVIDYDDMQSYLYLWLVKFAKSKNETEVETAKQVRAYCQAMWTDYYIDEAQDVSKIQFAILRAMITPIDNPNKLVCNLVFIGDDDQCAVEGSEIITSNGVKKIEDIQPWDYVLTGVGSGYSAFKPVDHISKKLIHDEIIEITTKNGHILRCTKNHIGFVKLVPLDDAYYTYIMYKHGIGFRIGTTTGLRSGNRKGRVHGIEARLMEEHADKIWIIKYSKTREESLYWEQYYSLKYSLPMYRFLTSDEYSYIPKTALNIDMVKKLHHELNTLDNGMRLLTDSGLSFDCPHALAQADQDAERFKINHSLFCTKAINKYDVHNSEVSINTSNSNFINQFKDLMAICEKSGTATGYKYSNARNTCSDIDEQSELVNKIANKCKENGIYVEVDRSAKFTQSKFIPMTFGGMLEGMIVPVAEEYVDTNDYDTVKQRIIEDTIISVKKVNYNGYVYDLSVPETRNFVANGIIVHNCIYQWRGSDPSIILSIAPTFDMRTFVLSTNYRCKNEIVDYATNGIKFNSKRYDKDMQAFEKGGSVKILPSEKEDLCNLSILALNHIKWWIEQGEQLNDIAVLSRNNFHLALLSNMLLREGIYCNMTEDMKLTKSYMYRDIKNILEISQPCWKSDITASMLWKLCRFLGMSNAMIISKFQSASSLSLEDTLGYLIKHFIDKTIDFNKKLNISIQAEEKMGYYINRMSVDTINDIKVVYYSLTCGDRAQCVKTLMNQYYSASKFMYKSKDKDRSIFGLIQYINNLIIKDGFDKMLEFLRITEQFENGRMAVLGQKVTLTTVHSAKGREWKNVIMFACDNVSQPSFDGMYSMIEDGIDIHDIYTNIDEERRLFYVGNTRAKENLLAITYKMPSVFILEALGAFTDKTNNNGNIIEAVQDNTYLNRFDKFIEDKIFNPESKYYYNIEEHKTNKEK